MTTQKITKLIERINSVKRMGRVSTIKGSINNNKSAGLADNNGLMVFDFQFNGDKK